MGTRTNFANEFVKSFTPMLTFWRETWGWGQTESNAVVNFFVKKQYHISEFTLFWKNPHFQEQKKTFYLQNDWKP